MKLWKKIKSWIINPYMKTLVLKKEDEINTELNHLRKQTKAELEKLGRKIGIELDRRLTKDKLIKQIRKSCK